MKDSIKTGVNFGLTSGTITTIGLMVGLYSGTNSKLAVVGGIITIAIVDALSDALGIHISEESKKSNDHKQVWKSTFSTFLSKFIYAITFVIPLLLFSLKDAVTISIIYGFAILTLVSFRIARDRNKNTIKVIGEHLGIAIFVIIATYFIGKGINFLFG